MLKALQISPTDPNDNLEPEIQEGNRPFYNPKLTFVRRKKIDEKAEA
jgi:hypothetical protein